MQVHQMPSVGDMSEHGMVPKNQVLERMEGRTDSWPASAQLPHAVHAGVDEQRAQETLLRWDGAAAEAGPDAATAEEGYLSDDDEDMFGGPRY